MENNALIKAKCNDIEMIYYRFEEIKDTKKTYEELKEKYLKQSNCKQGSTYLNVFEVDCDEFEETWILSRVKNTIIYGKSDYKNKEKLINIINSIGYGYD